MGTYCKAYLLKQLQEFPGWHEPADYIRKRAERVDGQDHEIERALSGDDIVYIQENYVVTDGIFLDENILFDAVTAEWQDFCRHPLGFEIPIREPLETEAVTLEEANL